MWRVLVICMCTTEAVEEHYITLGDAQFSGPDEQLQRALERRRALGGSTQATLDQLDRYIHMDTTQHEGSWRRQEVTLFDLLLGLPGKGNNTESTAPMFMVTKVIKLLMDNVKLRVREIQPLLNRYASEPRFRYGSVVCGLDEWRRQLLGSMTRLVLEGEHLTLRQHALTYRFLLAKNIDIDLVRDYLRSNTTNILRANRSN